MLWGFDLYKETADTAVSWWAKECAVLWLGQTSNCKVYLQVSSCSQKQQKPCLQHCPSLHVQTNASNCETAWSFNDMPGIRKQSDIHGIRNNLCQPVSATHKRPWLSNIAQYWLRIPVSGAWVCTSLDQPLRAPVLKSSLWISYSRLEPTFCTSGESRLCFSMCAFWSTYDVTTTLNSCSRRSKFSCCICGIAHELINAD